MNIAEIKQAVDAGLTVHWANRGYRVIKDSIGQYLIKFDPNGHCIGLTNRAGDTLNGQEHEFFCDDINNGRNAYILDCHRKPTYPDGTPRNTWEQLGEIERQSWIKNPTPRDYAHN